jgi:hypothetical protein
MRKFFEVEDALGHVNEVGTVEGYFWRWTPRQQEAGVAAHNDAEVDAGRARTSRLMPMKAWAMKRAAEPKPGVWSLPMRSLSMVLGTWMARIS